MLDKRFTTALTPRKRHSAECAEARRKEGVGKTLGQLRADRGYRRCACPIHAGGTLRIDGFVRKATGEVKWPKAEELKKIWEDAGTLEVAPPTATSSDSQEPPTVEHVVEQYMNDREACGLSPSTVKRYRQFSDLLEEFCADSGVVYITQFGIDQARTFRESWAGSPVTNLKRLERMRAFFSWVTAQRWIEINPAAKLKAPLTEDATADPISREDLMDLIGAIERMPARESEKNMGHDQLLTAAPSRFFYHFANMDSGERQWDSEALRWIPPSCCVESSPAAGSFITTRSPGCPTQYSIAWTGPGFRRTLHSCLTDGCPKSAFSPTAGMATAN